MKSSQDPLLNASEYQKHFFFHCISLFGYTCTPSVKQAPQGKEQKRITNEIYFNFFVIHELERTENLVLSKGKNSWLSKLLMY